MLTLSYGYKKPEDQDRGAVVFPALEDNIDRLNDHKHDGVDSAPLSAASVVASTSTLASGGWVFVADSIYKQVVTTPVGLTFDNTIKEYLLDTGYTFHPTVRRLSSTQFEVYINDNSVAVTVTYK